MIAFKGRFDGKVIVPEEPVDLPTNQRVMIHLQPINQFTIDFRTWLGLALNSPANPNPRFSSDNDLWEK